MKRKSNERVGIAEEGSVLSARYKKARGPTKAAEDCSIHVALEPRPPSLHLIFEGYSAYVNALWVEEGLLQRLLRGIFFGRPALDIQLIHVTSLLADRKAQGELNSISFAFASPLPSSSPSSSAAGPEGGSSRQKELLLSQSTERERFHSVEASSSPRDILRYGFWESLRIATSPAEGEGDRKGEPSNPSDKCHIFSTILLNRVVSTLTTNFLFFIAAVVVLLVDFIPVPIIPPVPAGSSSLYARGPYPYRLNQTSPSSPSTS